MLTLVYHGEMGVEIHTHITSYRVSEKEVTDEHGTYLDAMYWLEKDETGINSYPDWIKVYDHGLLIYERKAKE